MTAKLTREDLWSLEQYAEKRNDFRAQVIEHKKSRQVAIGPNATLYFEDRMVMQYQVQEMLRIERIFEKEAIQEELDAYNPLIPDGSNWKATFMLEFPDVEQRKLELAKLLGVEKKVWVRVGELDKVYPIANEDLERETEEKTSSVHFLRFELSPEMVSAAKSGAAISMGIDHDAYNYSVDPVAEKIRQSLVADLD
ncbi:MAG: DUF3501 family protein [Acidiferrobacterales bacterium]